MFQAKYPVDIRFSEEDGLWHAEVFDLPGCLVVGASMAEAATRADAAIQEWLQRAAADGRSLPQPSMVDEKESGKLLLRMPRSLHARLRRMADIEGVSLTQLIVALLAQREAEKRTSSSPAGAKTTLDASARWQERREALLAKNAEPAAEPDPRMNFIRTAFEDFLRGVAVAAAARTSVTGSGSTGAGGPTGHARPTGATGPFSVDGVRGATGPYDAWSARPKLPR